MHTITVKCPNPDCTMRWMHQIPDDLPHRAIGDKDTCNTCGTRYRLNYKGKMRDDIGLGGMIDERAYDPSAWEALAEKPAEPMSAAEARATALGCLAGIAILIFICWWFFA